VGVLWKITVPRAVSALEPWDAANWRDHHHAPTADPITPARIPYVRLLKETSAPVARNVDATTRL
jgi:hypothetical protein